MFDKLIAVAALVAIAACGLIGSSPRVIAAGALMLSSLRGEAGMAFTDSYGAALGRLEAASLFAAATLARSSGVCAGAYGVGQLLYW